MGVFWRRCEIILAFSWVILIPSFCRSTAEDTVLFHKRNQDQIQLSDIPDIQINNGSIISYIHQKYPSFEIYDTQKTRRCLAGKKLLFLGDSTMSETVDDLVILLSGMNIDRDRETHNDSLPHDAFTSYVANASNPSYGLLKFQSTYLHLSLSGNITVKFLSAGRRTMNVSCPSIDFESAMRFIGHVNLKKNYLGITTLENKEFEKELKCLLGENSSIHSFNDSSKQSRDLHHWSCIPRTHLILNSGLHDVHEWNKLSVEQQNGTDFGPILRRFLRRLAVDYPALKVIWKSVMLMPTTTAQFPPLPAFDRYHFDRLPYECTMSSDNPSYQHALLT